MTRIDAASAEGMTKLTLWKTRAGWQANAQFHNNGAWFVKTAATPSDAISAVLGRPTEKTDLNDLMD